MSATTDFRALVADTDHRDAGLLDMIERLSGLRDTSWALIRRAEGVKEGGSLYGRYWRDALASHEEQRRLERAIASTKAQTRLGAIAKGGLFLETCADNTGSMWDLPRAAIADLTAMLEGAGA